MTVYTTSEILIRPYRASDRAACIEVFRSNLPRYFDRSELPEFEAFLALPVGDYFVLEFGAAIVACGGCYVREGIGRLSWVWFQGRITALRLDANFLPGA